MFETAWICRREGFAIGFMNELGMGFRDAKLIGDFAIMLFFTTSFTIAEVVAIG